MPGLIFRDAVRFASACDAGNPAGRVHAAFANDAVRICIRGDAGVSASIVGAFFWLEPASLVVCARPGATFNGVGFSLFAQAPISPCGKAYMLIRICCF